MEPRQDTAAKKKSAPKAPTEAKKSGLKTESPGVPNVSPPPSPQAVSTEQAEGDGAARISHFLDLYKQLEDALEDRYRNARRHYSSAVFEFTKDYASAPVREKLDVCREIRNLITHNPNLDGQPIVIPSQPVVNAMEEVLDFVRKPPLALDFATKGDQVLKASLDQKVLRLMEVMDKNGYSHIPVMQEGRFAGVFSVGTVFRYLLHNKGKGLSPDMTVQDFGIHLDVADHMENYDFVPKTATYTEVRKKFERPQGKNKRIAVIFITETGSPKERLLGMLSPWDVLNDPLGLHPGRAPTEGRRGLHPGRAPTEGRRGLHPGRAPTEGRR